uniref:Uncharacterized protein n=1 Tax=Arundo donax TaxID=35708 RepID=A0A0A9H2A2_ARUDO
MGAILQPRHRDAPPPRSELPRTPCLDGDPRHLDGGAHDSGTHTEERQANGPFPPRTDNHHLLPLCRMRVEGRGHPIEREATPNPAPLTSSPKYTLASRSPSPSTPTPRRVLFFGVDSPPSFRSTAGLCAPIVSFTMAGPSTSTMGATTSSPPPSLLPQPSFLVGFMAAYPGAPPFFDTPKAEEDDGPASATGITKDDMVCLGLSGAPFAAASTSTPTTSPSGPRLIRRFAIAAASRHPGLRPGSWSLVAMGIRIGGPFDDGDGDILDDEEDWPR